PRGPGRRLRGPGRRAGGPPGRPGHPAPDRPGPRPHPGRLPPPRPGPHHPGRPRRHPGRDRLMELREVVRRRRMVRHFDPRPLSGEVLDRILHSATRAPSAGFSQGLDLVVLEGPEAVRGFWTATTDPRFGKPYSTAEPPVIVLVLSDPQAYLDRYGQPDKAGLCMDTEAVCAPPCTARASCPS